MINICYTILLLYSLSLVDSFWQVIEIAVISLTSEPEIDSSAFHIGDTSHLLHYVGSGPTGDSEFGFQLENLYDHFEILISDTEVGGCILSKLFCMKKQVDFKCHFCRLILSCLLPQLSHSLRNFVLLQAWYPVFYLMNQF